MRNFEYREAARNTSDWFKAISKYKKRDRFNMSQRTIDRELRAAKKKKELAEAK